MSNYIKSAAQNNTSSYSAKSLDGIDAFWCDLNVPMLPELRMARGSLYKIVEETALEWCESFFQRVVYFIMFLVTNISTKTFINFLLSYVL